MSILQLARPELLPFKGYSSARMEASEQHAEMVLLNANESPWLPYADDVHRLNRYPDPQPAALLAKLAEVYQLRSEQIFVGRGSDEPIDLLTRAFCRAGLDRVIIMPPTFGMYRVCAGVQGATIVEVPLKITADFSVDWDLLEQTLAADQAQSIKLIYFCTPNNPTGGEVDQARLQAFIERCQDRALVIVDEAYAEFSKQVSVSQWLARFANLVVLRTMSKAYGLAGARVGAMLANEEVIQLIRKIMPPYPVPSLVAAAALKALQDLPAAKQKVNTLVAERERIARALASVPVVTKVWASSANFLTFQVHDSATVYQHLKQGQVILRDVSHYLGLANCLRVSIGTSAENDRFIATLSRCPL